MPDRGSNESNRYKVLIERIFFSHWQPGKVTIEFERNEIVLRASELGVTLPKNLGDLLYSFRYRTPLPKSILETQPAELEWVIEFIGRAKYRFTLLPATRITPRTDLLVLSLADATPEVIRKYALNDEQALLAIVRYNRLIDTFLGLTTYSLQNHLRTTVKGTGQIEIDELYIGQDKHARYCVIPVQAKAGKDQIGVVQTMQDIRFSQQRYPDLRCRAVAAQFLEDGVIALFELTLQDGQVRVVEEKHYKLVPAKDL